MRRIMILTVAAGLALGIGCKGKSKKARLVTDAELTKVQNEHAARLKTYLAKSCKRPVLRGHAVAGSGTKALAAFGDAKGTYASCLGTLAKIDDVSGILRKCDKGMNARNCPSRALSDEPKKDAVNGVLAKCTAALAAMSKVVRHEEVCAPSRAGTGQNDSPLLGHIRIAHAAGFQARQMAREGKHVQGLQLAFDAARFSQDLSRPGASLIAAMISVATLSSPMVAAESILNAKLAWTPAELDAAVAEADKLIASQTPYGETMVGEGLYVLEELAKKLRGDVKEEKPAGTKSMDLHPNDEHGVAWFAFQANSAVTEKACLGTSLKACIDGVKKSLEGNVLEQDITKKLSADTDKMRKQIRDRIVAILRDIAQSSVSKYVRRHAGGVGTLVAMRAHLEYLRVTTAAKKCPDVAAATKALTPLLASKELGDPMTLHAAADGTLEVRLPGWAVYNEKKREPNLERLTVWRIH